jgi:P-type Mg2+ transporter
MVSRSSGGNTAMGANASSAHLRPYWSLTTAEALAQLGSGLTGLGEDDALARRLAHGDNALKRDPEAGTWRLAWRQFESPLVLILVVGGVISALLREWIDASIILAVVLGSSALGFAQEFRASNAVAQLRRRLAHTSQVRRDGVSRTVESRELVAGDLVELSAGKLVPADGLVLEARDFLVTEASLTGESFPVEKRPGVLPAQTPLAGRSNALFLGTSVRSGTATMLVVKTGPDTEFGQVAARLRNVAPATEFERGLQQFGVLLLRVMMVMVLFVLVINQLQGRPFVSSLLFAVALAVGLSPELLPAIVSVTWSAGARRMARRGVIVRRLAAIENLGSMDVLCTDKTGTLTEGVMTLASASDAAGERSTEVLRLAWINSVLESGIDNPLDAALVAAGEQAGLQDDSLHKIDEIPYDFSRKRLTIVQALADGGVHRIITKGAVAQVLEICTHVARAGGPVVLDDAERARLDGWFRSQGELGLRVLALATRDVPARSTYTRADEVRMCLAGFLSFVDPPKAEVASTLARLRARGVQVKVITGDNRYVAAHVAREVGLDDRAVLTGAQIAGMRDEALWHQAEQATLFVEVDPQQKERIVRALQHRGHAVGYLGDGINDAPALHTADVGISVDQAVDVARESADVVLLRPDLEVLCQGVEEGRHTFANTLKYIGITTSANFGNMVSMALATVWLPFLPLAAKQILLNNFLSDLPSIALATDRVDDEQLGTAQRWDMRDLRRYMLVFGLASTVFDLLTFAVLLQVFHAPEAVFQSAWFVVSLLTELCVVLLLRTRGAFWRSRPSAVLLGSTVVGCLIAMALPFAGAAAAPFGFVPLSPPLVLSVLGIVLAYVLSTEWVKRWFYAANRRGMR